MAYLLYKWLFIISMANLNTFNHPIFVSVTTIDHNAANKTLEISCKIFTDDFETALRKKYNKKVDLLDTKMNETMKPMVNDYIQKHLVITADNKVATLQFIGFEQQEEGIVSYFEVKNIAAVKKIDVTDNILFDEKPEQMEIIHVTVAGERKSNRLNNPESKVSFVF